MAYGILRNSQGLSWVESTHTDTYFFKIHFNKCLCTENNYILEKYTKIFKQHITNLLFINKEK